MPRHHKGVTRPKLQENPSWVASEGIPARVAKKATRIDPRELLRKVSSFGGITEERLMESADMPEAMTKSSW